MVGLPKSNRRNLPGKRALLSQAMLPGLQMKRWILLLLVGLTVIGLGLAFLIRDLYVTNSLPRVVYMLALTFLPHWVRGVLLLSIGLALAVSAVWLMNRSIIRSLVPGSATMNDLEILSEILQRRARRKGPKIVAIGGGTGMPQLLRGLREYSDDITAIVTVADDGGSSGRLRRQMGLLPPGDFRNNIAALSEAEDLMTRLFQFRFASQEFSERTEEASPLAGHSFGNLFIAAMASVTGGFESGIAESSRVLAVRGQVLPSTLEHLTLCAEVSYVDDHGRDQWVVVEGESAITSHPGRVQRAFLKPENARAYPAAVQAILQADLIVAGPGSFYTSVMPNLLVPSIREAICAAEASKIFICNVATQPGETEGYTVSDHMRHLRLHTGQAFQAVLANDNLDSPIFAGEWVLPPAAEEEIDYVLYTGDLVDVALPWRHDSEKLADRIMEVYADMAAKGKADQTEQHVKALSRRFRLRIAPH
jgi:uncharacterized cofD-like protein